MTRQDHANAALDIWRKNRGLPAEQRIAGIPIFDEAQLAARDFDATLDTTLARVNHAMNDRDPDLAVIDEVLRTK